MPRFDFNPSDITAGFPIFNKGTVEFEIGEPVSFYKTATQEGKEDNYGVRYLLKSVEDGKKYLQNCFMHTEGSRSMSKAFWMAALGIRRDQEELFNEKFDGEDWSFDPDSKTSGSGWHLLKGQHVVFDFETPKLGENGQQQNNVSLMRPVE